MANKVLRLNDCFWPIGDARHDHVIISPTDL